MERLMQYVWQHRLWHPSEMRTVDGRRVQVIDPGLLNRDAGPDFFNAKVKIDGRLWVGNIEIHVRASDWHRHHHDTDEAYDSVILHVVDKDDMAIRRRNGEVIPQLRMACSREFHEQYHALVDSAASELPCAKEMASIPQIYVTDWISNLAHQRLYSKVDRIYDVLGKTAGDWEETCYVTLARSLGFGINGESFERLAMSLPLRFMGKHSDSLLSLEALLFGQSGLLDDASDDNAYVHSLKEEYRFLANKFSLSPLQSPGWKMARMRPANFPHRRIALLAQLVHGGFRMMSRIVEAKTEADARELFDRELSGYWASHYSFNPINSRSVRALSNQSLNILLINAVVPLTYAYALQRNDTALCERAIALLQQLPAESNSIIALFDHAGIKCSDAFMSQALIQLRREYCEPRKCIYCRVGHRMLARNAKGK